MRATALSVVVAALVALPSAARAQQAPADQVTLVNTQHARNAAQYEAARKQHMAWHKTQGDTWAWDVYEVATGPDTGAYVVATGGHTWAEYDTWNAKMGAADNADAQKSMAGTIEGTTTSYWVMLPAQSRAPATPATSRYLAITYFQAKPGHGAALEAAVAKIKGALDAAKYAPHSIWYRLGSGGPGGLYAVVVPRASLSEMALPAVGAVLRTHLGEAQGAALIKGLYDNVESSRLEMLEHRPDLSYAPK
jgi:hypothetical protein